jgi:hypothetical protein
MAKKSFVTLKKSKQKYKLCSEDISVVYKAIIKKRPSLPAYEEPTAPNS